MESQSMHPKENTRGLQVNLLGDLAKIAQQFMVLIDINWANLVTCRAVYSKGTQDISVKKLCHVQKMKKVGACE